MPDPLIEVLFQPELLGDEKILWTGQPDPAVRFTVADIFLIPFSLLWEGFAFFWLASVIWISVASTNPAAGFQFFAILIGSIFNILGMYLVFGRFIYKDWKKRRTFYALTSRRALILTRHFGQRLEGIFFDAVAAINKSVRRNGTGTVSFGSINWMSGAYGNAGLDLFQGMIGGPIPSFYDIEDVESVYDLVQKQRAELGR